MSLLLKRLTFFLGTVLPLMLRTRRRPVLFVRQGAMGDILCTFPAALLLKERHRGAAFIYSCRPEFARLPVLAGLTKHVTSHHVAPRSRWRFLFAALYHFEYADEKAASPSANVIAEFCRQHGLPVTEAHPPLHLDANLLTRVRALLAAKGVAGPFVAIHAGPSWAVREWPREHWSELIKELKARGSVSVVQLGNGQHVQMQQSNLETIPGAVSLVGELSLEESFAVIALAHLFVGIDSGLLHVAACLRTRAVGIFGPTSPQFRFSASSSCSFLVSPVECQGCHHRVPRLHWMSGCPHDIRCMKTISTQSAVQLSLAQLARRQDPIP